MSFTYAKFEMKTFEEFIKHLELFANELAISNDKQEPIDP